jgi:hypothetical protein
VQATVVSQHHGREQAVERLSESLQLKYEQKPFKQVIRAEVGGRVDLKKNERDESHGSRE